MIGWAVVAAEGGREEIAEKSISELGYPTYLARFKRLLKGIRIVDGKRVRTRREGELIPRPLFPGYLFVELDPAIDQWTPIEQQPCVMEILKYPLSGYPKLIKPEVIEIWKHVEAIGFWDDGQPRRDLRELLDAGQTPEVRYQIENLAPIFGRLTDLDKRGQARIAIDSILGASAWVTVDARLLELVEET